MESGIGKRGRRASGAAADDAVKMSDEQPDAAQTLQLQRLFLHEMPALKGWFLAMVPDHALAEDLVQETFLTVITKGHSFEMGTNFRAWLFAIARFKLLAASRRPHAREVCLGPETMDALLADSPRELPGDERLELLERCIRRLAPRAREVIELRYLEAQAPPAIASALRWTVNAVNVALSRARRALRECIEAGLRRRAAIHPNP